MNLTRMTVLGVIVAALALGAGTVVVASTGVMKIALTSNPEAGLSDAQRNQAYQADWKAFQVRYRSWLAGLDTTKIRLHSLNREPLLAHYLPVQASSLRAAAARADVIVSAAAIAFDPTPFSGTNVTVRIERVYKGAPGATVVVHQAGGLRPTADWTGVYIAEAANAPLMLPGDRAILFLQRAGQSYEVQSFTGMYRIEAGRVAALRGNPFGGSLDGLTEDTLASMVTAAASS